MFTDRDIIDDLAIRYTDGEGDYLLCASDQCHVGEDDD
jgi:hypothetical protein